ncbi:MAG: DUF1730 domain-containing protein, partial [Clostridiales bacterium]|nr:DUF1730 domain-containing protein [Clostridiales bacterium]
MGEEGVMPLELIRNFAKQKNCLWGVCPARPIPGLRERLRARLARPPFVRADLDERLYPDRHLPGARSMIVLGLPYARQSLGFPADDPSGAITAMAAGEDYHRVLRGILGELAAALRARLDFH